jgi:hypothetical protein
VFKDGTGNLMRAGDFTADHANDCLLVKLNNTWRDISRSDNAT